MKFRTPRAHNKAHLDFIGQLPCLVCGDNTSIEAAHVRYGELWAGKRPTGTGEKPDDKWAVPLCGWHHLHGPDAQHKSNERAWWRQHEIDPIRIALALWAHTGRHDLGTQIVENARS